MKLSTRMIIGWAAVFAGGIAFAFEAGPWFFLGALLLSDVLRHRVQPRIPRNVERRRTWAIVLLGIVVLTTYNVFDVPDSPTHPLRIVEFAGLAAVVAWLIRDDIRVYRQLHENHAA